jgi:hypothetical protein
VSRSTLASQFTILPGMTPRLRVSYLPLHIYTTLGPPPPPRAHQPAYAQFADILAGGAEGAQSVLDATAQGPAVFVTCGAGCSDAYPLQVRVFLRSILALH